MQECTILTGTGTVDQRTMGDIVPMVLARTFTELRFLTMHPHPWCLTGINRMGTALLMLPLPRAYTRHWVELRRTADLMVALG